MSELAFNGGTKRILAYNKLKVFLANPGKFCLIVLGSRGTGKHFAIEQAFAQINSNANKELCLGKLEFISSSNFPTNEGEIDNLFNEHSYQTIVVEDVENLTEEQQFLLFKGLSTTDGTFGISKKTNLRVVFTSSMDIEALREDKNQLQGYFWDRISQLVIVFPSFSDEDNVIKDFYATWDKMSFQKTMGFEHFANAPQNTDLQKFLEDNVTKFQGGFRDLDKLACMYFNYRILHYGETKKLSENIEKQIVKDIKDDFFSKTQLHNNSGNELSLFQIQRGFSMLDLNAQFRIQVRKWAIKEYGTILKAEKALGLGAGTMKNYIAKNSPKSKGKRAKSTRHNEDIKTI